MVGTVYVISQKDGVWSDYQCLNPSGRDQGTLFGFAIFHAIVVIALAYGADALVIERNHARHFLQLFRELV